MFGLMEKPRVLVEVPGQTVAVDPRLYADASRLMRMSRRRQNRLRVTDPDLYARLYRAWQLVGQYVELNEASEVVTVRRGAQSAPTGGLLGRAVDRWLN